MSFSVALLKAVSNSDFLEHSSYITFPPALVNKKDGDTVAEPPIEVESNPEEDTASIIQRLPHNKSDIAEENQEAESGNIFSQGHSGCNPFNFTAKEHITIASVAYEISANFQHKVQPFLSTETSLINSKPFYDAYQSATQAAAINGVLVSAGKLAFAPPATMVQIAPQMIAIQQPLVAVAKVTVAQPNALLSQAAEVIVEEAPFIMARALVDLPERPMLFAGLDEEIQTHFSAAAENLLKEYEIKDTATRILETNTTQWNAMVQIAKENRFTDNAVNTIILELQHKNLVQKLQAPDSSEEKDALVDQMIDIVFDEQYIAAHETYGVIADILEEKNWLELARDAFNVDYDLAIEDEQYIFGEFLKVKFATETLEEMIDEFEEQRQNFEFDHDILENEILELAPNQETIGSVQQMTLLEKIAYRDFLEEIVPRIYRDQRILANGEDNDLPEDSEIAEENDDIAEEASGTFTNASTDFSSMMSTLSDMVDAVLGNGSVEDLNEDQRGILDVALGLYEQLKGLMTVSETLAEDTSESTEFTYDDSYEIVGYKTAEEEAEYDDAFTTALNRLMNAFDTHYGYADEPLVETTDSVDHSWDSYEESYIYDSSVTIDIAPEFLSLSDVEETVSITLADPRVSPALYNPVSVEGVNASVDSYDDSFDELFKQFNELKKLHAEAYPINLNDTIDLDGFDSLYGSDTSATNINNTTDSVDTSAIDFSALFGSTFTDHVSPGLDAPAFFPPTEDSIVDFSSLFPETIYI